MEAVAYPIQEVELAGRALEGAQGAGLRTCWINRRDEAWPESLPAPDLSFTTLAALADWLDAHHPHRETA